MKTSISHKLFLSLLKVIGAKKILGYFLSRKRLPYSKPNFWFRSKYSIKGTIHKNHNIWTFDGNTTLVYYLHGGAFVLGLNSLYYSMIGRLAKISKAKIVAPDYPLPPEHNVNEIHEWVKSSYIETIAKHNPNNIIIMGDSAGGNLAIALVDWIMTSELRKPSNLILLSPWVDLELKNPKLEANPSEQLLDKKDIQKAAIRFANGLDLKEPLISPLYHNNLKLPKTTIFSGDLDLLHDDIVRFSKKNPKVTLKITNHMPHVHVIMPTKEAKITLKQISNILSY
ncbi:MAG: alpha/beta hydrolase fold domain-containing protein [Hellea sp.]|jgi:acetyl esterase/lipase|nr:alpha/beta hydrolase fold domain-containing protein [Hellea sp.]MBT4996360.1 alpha/beta hydrolase fold domain-containing protein [Hellea sp.]MDA8888517.1 alpha/beta hydrolase [Hellea sp.]MDB4845073.1 alpha/beta hydrolase [Hellea sp.]MDC0651395.1 alpha/beta hydrolase [Hellea sp.]MDC1089112.1 alpha/beta hydrolase fold domain-containing protein [Hellea sp.]